MTNPDRRATYYIKYPGQKEATLGSSTLPTITDAAINVFSLRGGRRLERENALMLSSALCAATERGVPKNLISEAFNLGEKIGREVIEIPPKKLKDRITYRRDPL